MIAVVAKIVLVPAIMASLFTMCDKGPVPAGCCKHGDRLDVVLTRPTFEQDKLACNQMGGRIVARRFGTTYLAVCEDVDF